MVFGELGNSHTSLTTETADGLLRAMTAEQALGCLHPDSPFLPAAHDTVSLLAAINGLGSGGPWARGLRAMTGDLGLDVVAGDVPAAAQVLGGIGGAIRTDAARGKLTTGQAVQLHALVARVGADLDL